MAGDWIKMRTNLFTHPKVVRMASALKADTFRTVGGLMSVWCLFDSHSVDGSLEGYGEDTLDTYLRWDGFSAAMMAVNWLIDSGESLELPEFDTHNGASAKRRAQDSDRKRNDRKTSALEADKTRTREEKRREEITTIVAIKPATPDCPHQEIIALYHKHCPTMPQVRELTDKRRKLIQMRWREKAEHQSLEFWTTFFDYVNQSDFLTGRNGSWSNCNLEWLTTQGNFVKVIEGNYENRTQHERTN